jgi:hypothetical protein
MGMDRDQEIVGPGGIGSSGLPLSLSVNPRGTAFLGGLITLLILVSGVFLLRIYVKVVVLKRVTIDDYFMFTAYVRESRPHIPLHDQALTTEYSPSLLLY